MISVDEALETILQIHPETGFEECSLISSLGRVLGKDILSPHDQPPWDNSAMDGYAVLWSDVASVLTGMPVSLKVIEEIPSGSIPQIPLSPGCCSKIMTGAQVPSGADTVIPVEGTEKRGKEVLIKCVHKKGEHIRLKGEDIPEGKTVLNKGCLLRPPEIAVMASMGHGSVKVFKRPKVGILSTGDELVDLNEKRPPWKIYNSNGYALYAQVLEAGGDPLYLGIAPDQKETLYKKMSEGAAADLLILSGGVSMGDYDFVKDILSSAGKMTFWRIAMRPGSPMVYGEFNNKPFFGLPGNPVSCMVTFKIFVEPFIKKMGGFLYFGKSSFSATLLHRISKKQGLRYFLRGVVFKDKNEWKVRTTGEQGSHLLHSMVDANCLIDLPEPMERLEKGEKVSVLPLVPYLI